MEENKDRIEKLEEELRKEKSARAELQQEQNDLILQVRELRRTNQSLLEIIENLSFALKNH